MFAVALIAVTSLGERKRGESQRTNIRQLLVPGVRFGVGYGQWNKIDGFSEAVIRYIAEFEKEE